MLCLFEADERNSAPKGPEHMPRAERRGVGRKAPPWVARIARKDALKGQNILS